MKHNTRKPPAPDSFAKQATDWFASQFAVTKAIKVRDKKNTKAGKDAK